MEACLRRELREELGVEARIDGLLLTTVHDDGVKRIELHFFACVLDGDPEPRLGQQMRWVEAAALATLEFPAADAELISRLSASRSRSFGVNGKDSQPRLHRTQQALRLARRAHHGAEIHQRLIEVEDVPVGKNRA